VKKTHVLRAPDLGNTLPVALKSATALAMLYAKVAIPAPTHAAFSYAVPEDCASEVRAGARVVVSFRRRLTVGFVLDTMDEAPSHIDANKIKPIESVLGDAVFSPRMCEWLSWLASYYCAPIGEVCRSALPKRLTQLKPPKTTRPSVPRELEHRGEQQDFVLTGDQQNALKLINDELDTKKPRPVLLYGVTGSGKTEVYLRLFERVVGEGKQAILLVPEIGLTPQLTARVIERFGEKVALMHSQLTDAQRHHQWERIRAGEANVVVGTRSGLFAPLLNLGAIVIDEEHDSSYKQDEGVLYHARDAAVMRGQIENAIVVMGSATPSIESFANVQGDKYRCCHLSERTGGGVLPDVHVIDMRHEVARQKAGDSEKKRHEHASLSRELVDAIEATMSRGEQAMIFLNRRGFANFLICESCGHSFVCPNCDISLSYHRHPEKLLCHYCDYTVRPPTKCPSCEGIDIVPMGRGTERIEMELQELFPKVRIARLDRDTVAKATKRTSIFKQMHDGTIDILVGTQMIAKGHDFPNVTLVGIVSADVALHMPDFRAAERVFQLTTQVSGRAGRTSHGAKVMLQTFQPEHTSFEHARVHDFESFFANERVHREKLGYPPYVRLANVRMSATDSAKVDRQAHSIADELKNLCARMKLDGSVRLLGPAPAPMEKVRNRYRWQLLIKAPDARAMSAFLKQAHPAIRAFERQGLRIAIDVDPINLL